MSAQPPIRFWTTAPVPIERGNDWAAGFARLEDMGFDAVVMPDHFTSGWATEPMVALTAAALSTTKLRLATGVLGNDYRHPVLVHREAAVLDVISGGRVILGMGAGWLNSDYAALGIPMDPPSVRIARLAESVRIVTGLFGTEPVTHHGEHYRIEGLEGLPRPVSEPRPPLLLGGGRPKSLALAGAEADIVGINTNTARGFSGRHAVLDLSPEEIDRKIGWARGGAVAAGRSADDLEFHCLHWLVKVTATDAEARSLLERMAARNDVPVEFLEASPGVLVGTVERCVDLLLERRERYGFSYFQLDAGFALATLDTVGPLLERVRGL